MVGSAPLRQDPGRARNHRAAISRCRSRQYIPLDTFAKTNDAWLRVAPEVGTAAARTRARARRTEAARRRSFVLRHRHRHRRPEHRHSRHQRARDAQGHQAHADLRARMRRGSGRDCARPPTTSARFRRKSRCCCRSSCARSRCSARISRSRTSSRRDCSATAPPRC